MPVTSQIKIKESWANFQMLCNNRYENLTVITTAVSWFKWTGFKLDILLQHALYKYIVIKSEVPEIFLLKN